MHSPKGAGADSDQLFQRRDDLHRSLHRARSKVFPTAESKRRIDSNVGQSRDQRRHLRGTLMFSVPSATRSVRFSAAPLYGVISVTLRRPLFFLVARPEYSTVKDLKGKTLGIVTFGGSQHTTAKRLIALHGLNADKELTSIQIGEESMQLQALTTHAIQVAAISPPCANCPRQVQHEDPRYLHR